MTHKTDAALFAEIDAHMRKMWAAYLLPADCWPVGLAKRVSEAARRAPAEFDDETWSMLVAKHTHQGACNFRNAAAELVTTAAAPQPPEAVQVRLLEPFAVKHYAAVERPIIKGNGFDGLEIGEDREEAERFVEWVNAAMLAAILQPVKPLTLELVRKLRISAKRDGELGRDSGRTEEIAQQLHQLLEAHGTTGGAA